MSLCFLTRLYGLRPPRRIWSRRFLPGIPRPASSRGPCPLLTRISLEVRLPLPLEAIYAARDQIHTVVLPLQEHYDVLILASVVPLALCAG